MSEELFDCPKYYIRAAEPNDAKGLVSLVSESLPGYPFEYVYNPSLVKQELETTKDYRIVAVDTNGQIVATAVLGIGELMSEIKREVVHPSVRRNGIAKAMTQELVTQARSINSIAWSDVRADQIGMQRAALSAGLTPISLEQGKHIVYCHIQDDQEIGAARETMIHLTSLQIPQEKLYEGLRTWPTSLQNILIENLTHSFNPPVKSKDVVKQLLPSALAVKSRINEATHQLADCNLSVVSINQDIDLMSIDSGSVVIIKPDASGFIQNLGVNPERLLEIIQQTGLQVITYYTDIADLEKSYQLQDLGLQPIMIRPWQNPNQTPRWEVGWRQTMSNYWESLHIVQLDPGIEYTLRKFIGGIEENVN